MNKLSLNKITDLSKNEILDILDDANCFATSKKDWMVNDNSLIANLFFEPSTRTHYSFLAAEHELGLSCDSFTPETTSIQKGESLYDTAKTFEALGYKVLVIRHPENNYFEQLEGVNIPILNGGDGTGNHPTQSLLDLLTIYQEFGKLEGIKVGVIGDIKHSRVAHSIKEAMDIMGGETRFSGPKELCDEENYMDIDEIVKWADVVMMLRIQLERHDVEFNKDNYLQEYGLTKERVSMMQDHAIIMHPAPINRGIEIDDELVESEKSRIFKQMTNGVLVRKVLIKRALGYGYFKDEDDN